MDLDRRISRRWGLFLSLLGWAGMGWAQTIGTIPAQNYTLGATNPAIALTLDGFQTSQTLRTMAANTTSGSNQRYEGPGTRIFQGLKPDIVMIQEFNISNNTTAQIRSWVDTTFGTNFSYFRESSGTIPNGVISRWPILQAGSWDDSTLSDREFAWAQIDVPGPRNLWVVSVHLKASSGSSNSNQRNNQAQQLVSYIQANVPADDYLMIGGDCNTQNYSEACLTTLGSLVDVTAPRPADENNNPFTNAGRSAPYDWVMAEPELDALEVPVILGSLSFPSGLVFDSRVFSDLSLVSPVQSGDSGVSGMQHMAVVRSFRVDAPEIVTVQVQSSNAILLPAGTIEVLGSGLSRSLRITPAAGQTGSSSVTVTVSDGVATDTETFTVTVRTAASTFASWSGGATLNAANLAKYAIGGASSLTATDGQAPVAGGDATTLTITAIVRTDDNSLTITGEASSNLSSGWSSIGVTVSDAASQAGVPQGCTRKVFTVTRGSADRKFIRIKAAK